MVYPLDFSRQRHAGGLVFHWILLGHMNMESKGFVMHIHRNSFYNETLAYYPHAVYPLDSSGHGMPVG
jgi:hypothetical protein